MSNHSSDAVDKHVRIYKQVFVSLAILTVATVGCSYLELPVVAGLALGLAIAVLKGSLVGAFFMHLAWERKLIFFVLILTFFFFAAMMVLIVGHAADIPVYRGG